jgi:hypothetical protein
MAKLGLRELVCAEVLVLEKGKSVRSVARDLGVDESTLRPRLHTSIGRLASGWISYTKISPKNYERASGTVSRAVLFIQSRFSQSLPRG